MALPANYSTVPVLGRYIDFAGAPAQGTVTFTPSLKYVKDPGADVLILSTSLVATLDGTGAFSIEIPATDDPDVLPNGFTWNVTEHLNGKTWRTFSISVPQDTPDPGIDLVTVAPVLPADEVSTFVTSVDGQTGDVNLVGLYAPLDDGGMVPLDNLPEIVGGVLSVNGVSGVLLIGAADVGALPIEGGTLTGPLTLAADPTDPPQAATKAYVDAAVGDIDVPVTSVNGQVGAVSLTASGLGALTASSNLSDVANAGTARTNLGLGDSATKNTGTASGTVAAGDDGRLTGAAQKSANLSDLASTSTSRANLGLGGAAVLNVGTGSGTVSAGDDSRITGAAQKTANLSDLASASTARTNLGLTAPATASVGTTAGTLAAGDDSRITGAAQKASNLSDLGSASTARTNLGLGGSAVLSVGTGSGNVAAGDAPVAAASSAISTHNAASDPHGDRAYANGQFLPLAGGTVSGNLAVSGNLSVSGVGQDQFARKTADQSKTSTTTLGNDTHLVVPVVANATYALFLLCIFSGSTTGDIKFDWAVPSGTVLRWADQTGASGLNTDVDVYSAPGGTTQVAFQIWATVVTSSTAGNVQFRWAQNASDATATIVRANSMLQLTRAA
ncbi:hypothetical protein ACFU9Y_03950 [Streptomyces sp. NPDC057621]|uniref:hypothetical protein n=1 Tax=Streptomyces sp. NPDC057621 TaxID=3346186 RepID=UPI00367EA2CA